MAQVKDIQPGQAFFLPSRDGSSGNLYMRNFLGKFLMLTMAAPSPEMRGDQNDGTQNIEVAFEDFGGNVFPPADREVLLVNIPPA